MKDLYTENCKTLIKETEEDTINIKIFYVHELEELILIKCPYRPKQSTVNAVPIKIPRALFTHTKKSPNAWENHKRPWIDKAIYRSRTNLEVSHILISKLYYKAIIIKMVWYLHKSSHINQWNKIESPEINSHIYGQQIYDQGAKNNNRGK